MPENELSPNRIAYNPEAERAVLGACLLDAGAVDTVREKLRPGDFYHRGHQLIFTAIADLHSAGQLCDLITVSDALRANGELEHVGGVAYLSALMDAVPAPSAAPHYAAIVAENALVRALQAVLAETNVLINEGGLNARELIQAGEKAIYELSQKGRRGELYALSELLPASFVAMSNIKANAGVTGVPTFTDLDTKYLSGLQKGDLILLAARPGCGKTSMAMNIAQNAAAKHGRVAAIFSLEMPKEQLVQRMLCTQARVDHARVRKGLASKTDFKRLQKAVSELSPAQVYIDDTMSVTPTEIRSKCRKLKTEHGLDLIVIDYIQLMQSGGGRRPENRQLEVAEISRSLKELAKEMDAPVLALSQLSRQAETGKEDPGLAHLRESGALEQDADVVIILHRPKSGEGEENDAAGAENWKQSSESELVKVIVAKHRNGPTGDLHMRFFKQYTEFANDAQNWAGDSEAPPYSADLPEPDEDVF